MTTRNTPPYFQPLPSFPDLEVQFNSIVTQPISAAHLNDAENDLIFLSIAFEI